ncbi:protein of unknown function [Paraburkholderia dioscoreae]|uniref:Uncharacterized protein n=1 Tax=Paraburkholderia dioscoreae TaxID=2604047 RepID=A0A5Q4ZFK1_9BURK|nr:protein of unknown function [Paraburkholderia dioscoreae]
MRQGGKYRSPPGAMIMNPRNDTRARVMVGMTWDALVIAAALRRMC